jgi:DNA-directed RNA polymerase subunit E'/Rpb7
MSKVNKKSSSKKVIPNEEVSPILEPVEEVNSGQMVQSSNILSSNVQNKVVPTKSKKNELALSSKPNNQPFNLNNANLNMGEQSSNLYVNTIIHKRIIVPFTNIGNNMNEYFKNFAERNFEGKCHKEGFIKPFSTQIINYSTGLLKGDTIIYDVVISVDICFPYEGMELMCKIKNITKIGIRGVISDNHNPIILFISREHNATKDFEDYEEGQYIKIKVIGHRFEMNDEYISVIGEII